MGRMRCKMKWQTFDNPPKIDKQIIVCKSGYEGDCEAFAATYDGEDICKDSGKYNVTGWLWCYPPSEGS